MEDEFGSGGLFPGFWGRRSQWSPTYLTEATLQELHFSVRAKAQCFLISFQAKAKHVTLTCLEARTGAKKLSCGNIQPSNLRAKAAHENSLHYCHPPDLNARQKSKEVHTKQKRIQTLLLLRLPKSAANNLLMANSVPGPVPKRLSLAIRASYGAEPEPRCSRTPLPCLTSAFFGRVRRKPDTHGPFSNAFKKPEAKHFPTKAKTKRIVSETKSDGCKMTTQPPRVQRA